jgi:alginate O-acetyltransferase complex protein AlgI
MLFYEPLFLFIFLPSFYCLYLLGERRRSFRAGIILLASVAFYSWSDPFIPALVLASSLADWLIAAAMNRLPPASIRARSLLAFGIALNLAMLVYYKYTHFLIQSLDQILHTSALPELPNPDIRLPIGLSFVVFEKITYLVDIHRGAARPARNLLRYLLYVFFFPKLLAGPIIKYHELESQLHQLPRANINDFSAGLLRFMLGVVKKTLLGDTLAHGADMIFNAPSGSIGCNEAWLGVLLFTFQIYFDFSSYSDMAIGLARMLGFRLLENFNMPYISCSITEFWRRWHISLTTWIREYLYIPLGGNQVRPLRHLANLWICFIASGLWHGAAWTYVAWGTYNGLFLVLDKLFLLRALRRFPAWIANLVTFGFVAVGWTIFRATSLPQALSLWGAMLRPGATTTAPVFITNDIKLALLLAAFICAAPRLPGFNRWRAMTVAGGRAAIGMQTALALLFVAAVGKAVADPFTPFLYFRF